MSRHCHTQREQNITDCEREHLVTMYVIPVMLPMLLLHLSAASCPQECECLPNKEVRCNARMLTYVPEAEDSNNDFTSLDLSNNNLVDLSSDSFSSFPRLQKIDLRSNHIRSIYAMTFDDLKDLTIIQLDFNILESVPLAFQFNPSLIKLDLNGNPIDLNSNIPVSDSIKHLDLTQCKLKTIPPYVFAEFTQLEVLNLNHNLLQSLPQDFFESLPNLKHVYILDNPWKCGGEMEELLLSKRHLIGNFEELKCTTAENKELLWFPKTQPIINNTSHLPTPQTSGGTICAISSSLLLLTVILLS